MGLNNWMASLVQSTPLSRVSIPGTHDSCALYDHATAGYTQCQWLSIKDQLLNGIRFLDIRCTYEVDGKPFEITHGGYDQKITFAEVQTQVIDFLNTNPGESVLMNVQQEYSTAKNADFVARFDSIVAGHEDYWFFDERIPTVDEAKKRIVLIRAYDPNAFDPNNPGNGGWLTDKGLPWNGFNINGSSQNDFFNTQNASDAWEHDKKNAIAYQIGQAIQHAGSKFFLNFLSYAHFGATPGNNAKAMSPKIFDYIKDQRYIRPQATLGVLPMDFATNTPGFIEEIIRHNTFTSGVAPIP